MASEALVAVRPSTSSTQGDDLVEYLHRVGQHYDEHIDLLRRQKELREEKALTFQPALTERAYALEKTSLARRSEPIESRLHHLHAKKLEREQAQQAARERAKELAESQYTFQPQLSEYAASLTRPDTIKANAEWEAQREERLQALQARARQAALREVTGAPTITAYAQEKAALERPTDIPVEDLLNWHERQRQERLFAAAQEQLRRRSADTSRMDSALTVPPRPFEPSISQYASRLARTSSDSKDVSSVVERLYRPADVSQAVFDEAYALNCTFHPAISPASQELSQLYYDDLIMRGVDEEVHERLYANVAKPSKYRKSDWTEPTWRPTISTGSQRILERKKRSVSCAGAAGEAAGDRSPSSRLHSTALQHHTRKHAKPVVTPRDVEESTAYTHHPQVNTKSEQLWSKQVQLLCADGHARTPEEARTLLWRRAQRRSEERVQRCRVARETSEREECTFAPKAGRSPRRRIGGGSELPLADRAEMWAQQRESKLAEARVEKEEQEMAQHPFRPHVDPVFPLPSERTRRRNAPGVSAFLARQEEARRRREEAARVWAPQHADTRSASRHMVSREGPLSTAASVSAAPGVVTEHYLPASEPPQSEEDVDSDSEEEREGVFEAGSSEESFFVHHPSGAAGPQDPARAARALYADLPYRPVPSAPRAAPSRTVIEGSPVALMLSRQRAVMEEY